MIKELELTIHNIDINKSKNMEQQTIFNLIEIEYGYDKEEEFPQYPLFKVNECTLGYYSTLDNVEQALKRHLIELKEWEDKKYIFGFFIFEYELDRLETTYSYCKSKRSYLSDGTLLDECLISEYGDVGNLEKFYGRPAEKIRFKVGDIVEVLQGDEVSLEIIHRNPPILSDKCVGDSVDDCYFTIQHTHKDDHSHPECVYVFPCRFPVSEELQEKLKNINNNK